jgi:hypothetical protein
MKQTLTIAKITIVFCENKPLKKNVAVQEMRKRRLVKIAGYISKEAVKFP